MLYLFRNFQISQVSSLVSFSDLKIDVVCLNAHTETTLYIFCTKSSIVVRQVAMPFFLPMILPSTQQPTVPLLSLLSNFQIYPLKIFFFIVYFPYKLAFSYHARKTFYYQVFFSFSPFAVTVSPVSAKLFIKVFYIYPISTILYTNDLFLVILNIHLSN